MSSAPRCWRGVLWVRWCNGLISSQPSMCWDTTSRSRFLSKSCTGKYAFDLFLSDCVNFEVQTELLQFNVQSSALFGDIWGIYEGIVCYFSLILLTGNSLWSILNALRVMSSPIAVLLPHTLFSVTFGHTEISYLTFLQSAISAWGLDSISAVCAPPSCHSSLITYLSLIITNISAYAHGHTHTHNVPFSQTHSFF